MDRLINADKLPRHGKRGGLVNWYDIEKAPTVDAIPVEWLKRYAENHPSCIQEFRYMLVDWREHETD